MDCCVQRFRLTAPRQDSEQKLFCLIRSSIIPESALKPPDLSPRHISFKSSKPPLKPEQ
uniref:Uncharacterized protein n=1 Tax=Brassica oleracea var. oleracea TaxID=109376 RepID=A0A0D2ZZ89_BRAOL